MCDFHQTVDTARGQQLARELGIPFFETSAKDGTNVSEAINSVARDVVLKMGGAGASGASGGGAGGGGGGGAAGGGGGGSDKKCAIV